MAFGSPASSWMWARAVHQLGAVIRLCGDGAVSKGASEGGVRVHMKSTPPPVHRTGPFRPTLALQMPNAGVPASPLMWAKAVHQLSAVIRQLHTNLNNHLLHVLNARQIMIYPKEFKGT
jgi:hypothetical protein